MLPPVSCVNIVSFIVWPMARAGIQVQIILTNSLPARSSPVLLVLASWLGESRQVGCREDRLAVESQAASSLHPRPPTQGSPAQTRGHPCAPGPAPPPGSLPTSITQACTHHRVTCSTDSLSITGIRHLLEFSYLIRLSLILWGSEWGRG